MALYAEKIQMSMVWLRTDLVQCPLKKQIKSCYHDAVQSQAAVSAYFTSNQILALGLAKQYM